MQNARVPGRHRKPRRTTPGRHRAAPPPRRHASAVLAGLVVLGISSVGALTALNDAGHDGTPASSPMPAAVRLSPTAEPSRSSPTPAPASSAAAPAALPVATRHPAPAAFVISATGRVAWVSVRLRHRRTLFEGMLRHGRLLRFTRHPLEVVIGDAGAVRIVIHGRVRSPAGRAGQVLRFTVR